VIRPSHECQEEEEGEEEEPGDDGAPPAAACECCGLRVNRPSQEFSRDKAKPDVLGDMSAERQLSAP